MEQWTQLFAVLTGLYLIFLLAIWFDKPNHRR